MDIWDKQVSVSHTAMREYEITRFFYLCVQFLASWIAGCKDCT